MTRRRIMRAFDIAELSAVDHPAQAHARMAIMKRQDERQEQEMDQFENAIHDEPRAFDTFEQAMEAIRARDKCSGTQAMSRAADEHPDLLKRYQDKGFELVRKAAAAEPPGKPKAERAFNAKVAEVARARGISRTAAMAVVRREYPDLYEAMQIAGP